MWVTHARRAASGFTVVGRGHPPLTGTVETILIAPVARVLPVRGLLVRSLLIERVRSPSGLTKQLQHSVSSWKESNTKMLAQTLPAAVPGLMMRTVPSGAPAVLALEK